MKYFLLLAALSFVVVTSAQSTKAEVKGVVDLFFQGLNSKDTAVLKSTMAGEVRLETVVEKKEVQIRETKLDDFLKGIEEAKDIDFEEKILDYQIQHDGPMAVAWTSYDFFREGKLSHCGVNVITLLKSADGWKIYRIIDTRRKSDCREQAGN